MNPQGKDRGIVGSTIEYDYVVIGGGIAGASIGYELSESARVLLLEREASYGFHTTGSSAATYIELLHNQTIFSLTRGSLSFLHNPPAAFTEAPLVTDCGCIITGNASEQASLQSAFEQAMSFGIETRLLVAEEIKQLVPIVKTGPDTIEGGLFEPQAKRIDVERLLQGYLKGLRSRGGMTTLNCQLESIQRIAGVWHMQIGDKEIRTQTIVNAAGAWVDEIAELAGIQAIGFEPLKRTMITFDGPENEDTSTWPLLGNIGRGFYFVPEIDQFIGSPADETLSLPGDALPDDLDVATAAYNIEQHTNLQVKKINHRWAGLRTFAPDRLPVIGFSTDASGFFWFAGQGGFGIQAAPAMAKLGAALAQQNEGENVAAALGIDLANVLPGRFFD